MSETKELLEATVKGLQDKINYLNADLKQKQKELEDVNKPVLTPKQLDDIHEAVEKAIENYSFSDCDNYEVDFSLDYDGRVQLETIDLQDTYQLVEMIVDKVCNLFKEVDCPEDDNSQVNTQTVAEKII